MNIGVVYFRGHCAVYDVCQRQDVVRVQRSILNVITSIFIEYSYPIRIISYKIWIQG